MIKDDEKPMINVMINHVGVTTGWCSAMTTGKASIKAEVMV
jgi:hypothetical protein